MYINWNVVFIFFSLVIVIVILAKQIIQNYQLGWHQDTVAKDSHHPWVDDIYSMFLYMTSYYLYHFPSCKISISLLLYLALFCLYSTSLATFCYKMFLCVLLLATKICHWRANQTCCHVFITSYINCTVHSGYPEIESCPFSFLITGPLSEINSPVQTVHFYI